MSDHCPRISIPKQQQFVICVAFLAFSNKYKCVCVCKYDLYGKVISWLSVLVYSR